MTKKFLSFLQVFFLAGGILFLHFCAKDKAEVCKDKIVCDSLNVKYSADIKPIIQSHCVTSSCHDICASFDKGDFTTYSGLKTKVYNGSLKSEITNGNPTCMPASNPLSNMMLKKINCWLLDGAPNN